MWKSLMLAVLCTGSAGCLPVYSVSNAEPTAKYQLVVENDSTATTGQNIFTWAFKNEKCERSPSGMRLGSKFSNGSSSETDIVSISASQEFAFTAVYVDARFGQNRQCNITGAFMPQQDHIYKAKLIASQNVQACKLGVYDVTTGDEQKIQFSMPEHVCMDSGESALKNGQPLWIGWRINPTSY